MHGETLKYLAYLQVTGILLFTYFRVLSCAVFITG